MLGVSQTHWSALAGAPDKPEMTDIIDPSFRISASETRGAAHHLDKL
jgi:hypothetical protein